MQLKRLGHLTYCSNIHPGERWEEVFGQLRSHLPAIRRRLSPDAPFGLGLRLSAEAATTLAAPERLGELRSWLAQTGIYVFTLNGFPYGRFHGEPVKAAVYRPDWSRPERVDYTCRLADILAGLLPAGVDGSISTVPGAFAPDITGSAYRRAIVDHLLDCAAHLWRLEGRSGRCVRLALEPEPGCMLQTAEDTAAFFVDELFGDRAIEGFAGRTDQPSEAAARWLRDRVGVCLDTCHAAVMFEEPLETARRLQAAGIRVVKLQLTAALAVEPVDAPALDGLRRFHDEVYLHQTTARSAAGERRFLDLPDAIAAFEPDLPGQSWRSHFHVPVFLERLGAFRSTSPALARLLHQHRETPLCDHLEVETYTFDVLPEEYRLGDVTEDICRELEWVRRELAA